jgi:hypothetical protein
VEYLYSKDEFPGSNCQTKVVLNRSKIIKEVDKYYIAKGLFSNKIYVLKDDLCSRNETGFVVCQYYRETPELLKKWNDQQLEYEYKSKVREFLETSDHETMRKIIDFLDKNIFKGE